MIDLYYWPTPNGHKVTLMLEELAEARHALEYSLKPVNIGVGDQFKPEFLAISPNNRMPAIVDHAPADGAAPLSVFESGAILLYLADKTGRFIAQDLRGRTSALEWLFWQMGGLGPMSGQMGHFHVYAPEKISYPMDRYRNEVRRLHGVLDKRLSQSMFLAGDDYGIADMASYPWIDVYPNLAPDFAAFSHLARWHQTITERPATARAYAWKQKVHPQADRPLGEEERRHLFGSAASAK